MKIGELARRAGVGVDTVRYYERLGLLPAPRRKPSGYRAYTLADVSRLQFVCSAKGLGFSLEEIRELLALSEQSTGATDGLSMAASGKLRDVETKLTELTRIRDGLRMLVETSAASSGPQE